MKKNQIGDFNIYIWREIGLKEIYENSFTYTIGATNVSANIRNLPNVSGDSTIFLHLKNVNYEFLLNPNDSSLRRRFFITKFPSAPFASTSYGVMEFAMRTTANSEVSCIFTIFASTKGGALLTVSRLSGKQRRFAQCQINMLILFSVDRECVVERWDVVLRPDRFPTENPVKSNVYGEIIDILLFSVYIWSVMIIFFYEKHQIYNGEFDKASFRSVMSRVYYLKMQTVKNPRCRMINVFANETNTET